MKIKSVLESQDSFNYDYLKKLEIKYKTPLIQLERGKVPPLNENTSDLFITSQWEIKNILKIFRNRNRGHLCQFESGSFEQEIYSSTLMIHQPDEFLIHPVQTILNHDKNNSAEILFQIQFATMKEKNTLLEETTKALQKKNHTSTVVSQSLLIADELITNAILNGPKLYNIPDQYLENLENNTPKTLDPSLKAEFILAQDENRILILCRDDYGSLDVIRLMNRLYDCNKLGLSASMRMGTGGAGIGSYLIFNTGSSYYVGVKKGLKTVIGSTLHWKWSHKKRSSEFKNIHIFQI
ncbi:MAG: hypothetical protein K1X29_03910 [Bdellovibrionales bacterium]|nr:hypothetical protein [Bdellovibrionales bacterium]